MLYSFDIKNVWREEFEPLNCFTCFDATSCYEVCYVGSTFLIGAGFLGTGDDSGFGFWIITALGGLVGTVCILTKLVAKLKAFEEAED